MRKFTRTATCPFVLLCLWLLAAGFQINPADGRLSIVEKLKSFDHLPVAERIALYYQLKKDSAEKYDFNNETQLTLYGYAILWNNKTAEAIEIFKLIVTEFPESSNAYDSLGEAYMKSGDWKLSLENYAKSLALNPANFNAEDQIEKLKYPDRKSETPAEKFTKVFTGDQYRADLDDLGRTLLKVHPNALKFISEKDFFRLIEEKKALVTNRTTFGEFAWYCSEIIASVHCSHTSMGSFYPENDMLPHAARFPLQTRWVNDKLYVADPFNNADKINVKDEIVKINGIKVSAILKEIYGHIPSQGYVETTKKHFFNRWSTALIAYSLGFPPDYTVELGATRSSVRLQPSGIINEPLEDRSVKRYRRNLNLEFTDAQTAILTIASFNFYPWSNLDVFKKFIDSSFTEINSKAIKNLIIDVRLNGGGSQQSSIHLLRYLLHKPFTYYSQSIFKGKIAKIDGEDEVAPFENRYKGKLFFMIDGNGQSTTGHFMSLVKIHKLGTIVGEELGSNQFCSAGQTICRLKSTRLEYYVADNTHESTATSLPDELGILPDYYVTQGIDDYLQNIDVVRNFTLRLANPQKKK